ncbi:ribonuclease Trv [Parathielavia appendiculata]|uniref:Ribonuclease Trv n=1 Tax=Parathielavia appendiculata TaxID=2587402 RepID=A0AAN6Z6Y6_9PEZI|nr:ribonuclease Trv [Parathielavia appendiculata]
MATSLRALLSYASDFVSHIPFLNTKLQNVLPYEPLSAAPFCPLDGPMSCHNNTPVAGDSCCFVQPGGRMVLAQFWDWEVYAAGAEEDWTLRGLWPALCDGTPNEYCQMIPHYTNISSILRYYGQDELFGFMDRYWLAASGPNNHFWQQAYTKHATCINTLSPACYGAFHSIGLEVVDYFTRAAALFRTLDTYRALQRAKILPDPRRRYPREDVQRALEIFSGGRVVLRCTGSDDMAGTRREDVLHEVWYVYFVRGSLQTGQFVPAQELGEKGDVGNCASEVTYLPKTGKGEL